MIKTVSDNPIVVMKKSAYRSRVMIQNVGENPCLFRVDGNPDIDNFDFVLSSDGGDRKGFGGSIVLEGMKGELKAITEVAAGTNIAILEIFD